MLLTLLNRLSKYLIVYFTGIFKFVPAPLIALYQNLTILEATLLTTLGTMTTVVTLTMAGERFRKFILKKFFRKRKLFTPGNRKKVRFIRKYGIKGVAFLTPVVFGPVIGALLASTLGAAKHKIFLSMLICCLFWAFVLSLIFDQSLTFWSFLQY